jgi:hypothetical protein
VVCDFCNASVPDLSLAWTYPARDFTLPGAPLGSVAGWLACEECSRVVDLGDAAGLARRAAGAQIPPALRASLPEGLAEEVEAKLAEAYRHFYASRMGERRRPLPDDARELTTRN